MLRSVAGTQDVLRWKWRGAPVSVMDFGDPAGTDDYVLCVYENAGAGNDLVFERDVSAGATCDGSPFWSAAARGYVYEDSHVATSPIDRVRLLVDGGGRGKISVSGRRFALAPPRLPFATNGPLTVQLGNVATGTCWESRYSTALTNTSTRFNARSR